MGRVSKKEYGPGQKRLLTFLFPPLSLTRLENLKRTTEASTYAEVVRRALALYENIERLKLEGHTIQVKRSDGQIVTLEIVT